MRCPGQTSPSQPSCSSRPRHIPIALTPPRTQAQQARYLHYSHSDTTTLQQSAASPAGVSTRHRHHHHSGTRQPAHSPAGVSIGLDPIQFRGSCGFQPHPTHPASGATSSAQRRPRSLCHASTSAVNRAMPCGSRDVTWPQLGWNSRLGEDPSCVRRYSNSQHGLWTCGGFHDTVTCNAAGSAPPALGEEGEPHPGQTRLSNDFTCHCDPMVHSRAFAILASCKFGSHHDSLQYDCRAIHRRY